jgi:hypothetical protein
MEDYRVLVGGQRERDHYKILGIGRKILLKWILDIWDKAVCLRMGPVGGSS